MTRNDVTKSIKSICTAVGESLEQRCLKVYDKMTPAEVERIAENDGDLYPARVAKALMLAVAADELRQYSHESIVRHFRLVRHVDRTDRGG